MSGNSYQGNSGACLSKTIHISFKNKQSKGMKNLVLSHVIRMTKLFTYAFLIQCLSMSFLFASNGNAQVKDIEEVMISITLEDTKIEKVFSTIEKMTGFSFVYTDKELRNIPRITKERETQSVYDLLSVIGSQTGLYFKQVNQNIHVRRIPRQDRQQDPVSDKEGFLEVDISGKVTDENGEPLIGVSVLIEGTSNGTTTDIDGNFTIDAPDNSTLVLSYIGYETRRVAVGNQTSMTITMRADQTALEEFVIVGYGEVRRRDLTGSVVSVRQADIQAVPVTSPDQILQGRVSGVQVTQASAAPGGGVTIRVRGSNSINAGNEPLYVIDGFPVYSDNNERPSGVGERTGGNILATINPNDIESIEVLKDASATAIYGSRGANGVILITTKRGRDGVDRVTVNSYYGVQQIRRTYDMMNTTQLVDLANEFGQTLNNPSVPYPAVPTTDTDWQREVFRMGRIQNHSLNITGGNANTNYLVSGELFQEEGIIPGSEFTRGSVRFNLDKKINNFFKFGNSLAISLTENDARDILQSTLRSLPMSPVYDEFGNFFIPTQAPPFGAAFDRQSNPVAEANDATNKITTARILGNIYGEFNLAKNLVGKVLVGADINYSQGKGFAPFTTLGGLEQQGFANVSSMERFSWLNENTLTYNKSWDDRHRLSVLGGYSWQTENSFQYQLARSRFPTDATSFYLINAGVEERNTASSFNEYTIQSFFGRINYSLNNKYLFTFTGRSDGSSKFGEGRKFGFFPSGAFAWQIGDEDFIRSANIFTDLKLRTSYGITGNQEIPPYRSLSILRGNRGQIIGGNQVTGFAPANELANPELGWEETSQFDIGIDMGFFNNRLMLTADYYHKLTRDLLFLTTVPVETGFANQWRNIGNVENRGVEFSLRSENAVGQFQWNTDANFSFNNNNVTSLPDDTERLLVDLFPGTANGFSGLAVIKENIPLGSFYTYQFNGIWQSSEEIAGSSQIAPVVNPGDPRYRDVNADGRIDGNDRVVSGTGIPRYLFGLNNNLSYRNFELNVFFQGVADVDVVNLTRFNLENARSGIVNTTTTNLARWSGPNTTNEIPRAGAQNVNHSDQFIEDGSFIRLRTLTLGYNFPMAEWGMKWIQGLRLYVTGQNLITWTNYSGFDPEVNAAGQAQALQGIDQWSYPMQRRYVMGLNLNF